MSMRRERWWRALRDGEQLRRLRRNHVVEFPIMGVVVGRAVAGLATLLLRSLPKLLRREPPWLRRGLRRLARHGRIVVLPAGCER